MEKRLQRRWLRRRRMGAVFAAPDRFAKSAARRVSREAASSKRASIWGRLRAGQAPETARKNGKVALRWPMRSRCLGRRRLVPARLL